MRANWMNLVTEEKGNVSLLMIGLLGIMMVLFVFVLNLTKVFAVKEEALTTTQQASLAASSVLYGEMEEVIAEYEKTPEGILIALKDMKTIDEKIQQKKLDLEADSSYSDYSDNEKALEAMDIVLTEELTRGIKKPELHKTLEMNIEQEVIPLMIEEARETILKNEGNLTDATMTIEDGQVFVHASNTLEGTSFKGFFAHLKEDLFQTAAGPKIDFLEVIDGFESGEESLGN